MGVAGERPGNARQPSVKAFAARFGGATLAAQLGQVVWLVAGSRVMPSAEFGAVLAAQALYGFLQIAVDNGPAWHGARLAAAGSLDDDRRGELFRLRLQLTAPSLIVGLAVGVVAGRTVFLAIVPFMLALVLFALLNYWEDFGRGKAAPWSSYIALRALGPGIVATIYWLAGVRFPTPLAGCIECAAILVVAWGFRLQPLRGLTLARHARRGPWQEAISIGSISVLTQGALTYGTVLLAATGHAASAAVLAVGIRFLTGVSSVLGVVITALFPALARQRASNHERWSGEDQTRIVLVGWIVILVAATATGVVLSRPSFFMTLLLSDSSRSASATASLLLGSAAGSGLALLFTAMHIARSTERIPLHAVAVSTAFTVTATTLVLAGSDSLPSRMALALLTGQILLAFLLSRATAARAAELAPAIRTLFFAAIAIAGLTLIAVTAPGAELSVAAILLVAASFIMVITWRLHRDLRGRATS